MRREAVLLGLPSVENRDESLLATAAATLDVRTALKVRGFRGSGRLCLCIYVCVDWGEWWGGGWGGQTLEFWAAMRPQSVALFFRVCLEAWSFDSFFFLTFFFFCSSLEPGSPLQLFSR